METVVESPAPVSTIKKVRGGFTRKPRRRLGGASEAEPDDRAETGAPGSSDGGGDDGPQKHRLCVETLIEGYVQSYVDFFYLTHRADPNPDPNKPESSQAEIVVPVKDMLLIKKNLTDAESARRQGDTRTVYDSYDRLAQYYQSQGSDLKTAVYFYEKCLEIARLTSDNIGEMNANHHLGLAHAALGDVPAATGFHEAHLELAKASAMDDQSQRACVELTKMYKAQAQAIEADLAAKEAAAKARAKAVKAESFKQKSAASFSSRGATTPGDVRVGSGGDGGVVGPDEDARASPALTLHEQCLTAARGTGDAQTVGLANYRLGCALVEGNDPKRGIDYLTEYLGMCTELKDVAGQGAASAALARAHLRLDSVALAVEHLERFLQIAKKTDNLAAQASACCNLGIIYNRRGEFQKAVHFFEKNYETCRSMVTAGLGSRELVDRARVHLGMARGNAQMGAYMRIINHDMPSLLRWKNRRFNFGGEAKS